MNIWEWFCVSDKVAVVIGGTSFNSGRGSNVGTVFDCLIICVLNKGLVLMEVSTLWQKVIRKLVILIMVSVNKIVGQRSQL